MPSLLLVIGGDGLVVVKASVQGQHRQLKLKDKDKDFNYSTVSISRKVNWKQIDVNSLTSMCISDKRYLYLMINKWCVDISKHQYGKTTIDLCFPM